MSFQKVIYKLPRTRKPQDFVVYPWSKDDESRRLQSSNYCMIVFVSGDKKGKSLLSPRANQYPIFEMCMPQWGGKLIDTPQEITDQLEALNETGKVVTLVG